MSDVIPLSWQDKYVLLREAYDKNRATLEGFKDKIDGIVDTWYRIADQYAESHPDIAAYYTKFAAEVEDIFRGK